MSDLSKDLRKLTMYLDVFVSATEAVESGKNPPSGLTPLELEAFKVSCRNIAIAHEGLRADFLGTISTEPVTAAQELEELGLNNKKAEEVIAARDIIRVDAFKLAPVKLQEIDP